MHPTLGVRKLQSPTGVTVSLPPTCPTALQWSAKSEQMSGFVARLGAVIHRAKSVAVLVLAFSCEESFDKVATRFDLCRATQ
eukprot:1634484-Amphidinium_carterae.1